MLVDVYMVSIQYTECGRVWQSMLFAAVLVGSRLGCSCSLLELKSVGSAVASRKCLDWGAEETVV